ncbi:hypothetical protein DPMN_022628 [Dreissena polymorpha]|uniref:Uncharacterized protein n=1 Tax=Dreissena polymorpha TaxID=45954 RepID=A0A9D4NKP1_DREPO|nr:hypothetical protein DPMN_022628 [Dreissena polymorpha]
MATLFNPISPLPGLGYTVQSYQSVTWLRLHCSILPVRYLVSATLFNSSSPLPGLGYTVQSYHSPLPGLGYIV